MRESNKLEIPPNSSRPKTKANNIVEEQIQTSFRLPESRWRKLQALRIEERTSVQAIIITALEAEFAKRGISF